MGTRCGHCTSDSGFEYVEEKIQLAGKSFWPTIRIVRCASCKVAIGALDDVELSDLKESITTLEADVAEIAGELRDLQAPKPAKATPKKATPKKRARVTR